MTHVFLSPPATIVHAASDTSGLGVHLENVAKGIHCYRVEREMLFPQTDGQWQCFFNYCKLGLPSWEKEKWLQAVQPRLIEAENAGRVSYKPIGSRGDGYDKRLAELLTAAGLNVPESLQERFLPPDHMAKAIQSANPDADLVIHCT